MYYFTRCSRLKLQRHLRLEVTAEVEEARGYIGREGYVGGTNRIYGDGCKSATSYDDWHKSEGGIGQDNFLNQ